MSLHRKPGSVQEKKKGAIISDGRASIPWKKKQRAPNRKQNAGGEKVKKKIGST